jgi:hypothetical protein
MRVIEEDLQWRGSNGWEGGGMVWWRRSGCGGKKQRRGMCG